MQRITVAPKADRARSRAPAVLALGAPRRLAAAAMAAAIFAAAAFSFPARAADNASLATAKALSDAYADVVEKVTPGVVGIVTEKTSRVDSDIMEDENPFGFPPDLLDRFFGDGFRGLPRRTPRQPRRAPGIGSGVIFDAEGHILTNNHVVDGADSIKVELSGRKEPFDAEVVGRDPNTDIAVIRLKDAPSDLLPLKFGNSDELRVGNIVVAIGAPMGFRQSVTTGVVSAKDRNLSELAYERFIQTDASINPGNSGGPLVNLDGEVVGINTMISTRGGGSIGIGFAIPISQAKRVVSQLVEKGSVTRGWLGIQMNHDDPEISRELGHDGTGVLVSELAAGGPAEKAGVMKGDLIVSYNGVAIRDNDHLRYMVADTDPGVAAPLVILRNNEKMELAVTIEVQPADLFTDIGRQSRDSDRGSSPDSETADSGNRLGLSVRNIDDDMRERFGLGGDAGSGVVVTRVDPDGPAADMGLEPGVVIVEMDRRPVSDVASFREILRSAQDKDKILMNVRKGEVSRYLIFKLKQE